MGLIRSISVSILSIALFLTLFSANSFLTVSMSLDYKVLEPELTSVVGDILQEQVDLDETMPLIQKVCQNKTNYVFSTDDFVFTLPCDIANQGQESIIDYFVKEKVDEVYYKEYDCEFLDCSSETDMPTYLFSLKAKRYWRGWFYSSLLVSLLLLVGLFFLFEKRNNIPFLIGGLFILASLPFLGVGWLLSLVTGWEYVKIFSIFFTQAYITFLIGFISGILLIGIGFVLKFINAGKFLSGIFNFGKTEKKKEKPSEPKKDSDKKKGMDL